MFAGVTLLGLRTQAKQAFPVSAFGEASSLADRPSIILTDIKSA
jgi:hypothetical protein